MERRKFIIGTGALAAGGAAALGSGAFSSVEADRSMNVTVAEDSVAYVDMKPISEYARTTEDGLLSLDFGENSAGGDGLNANATSEFSRVFCISNHGTQEARYWIDFSDIDDEFENDDVVSAFGDPAIQGTGDEFTWKSSTPAGGNNSGVVLSPGNSATVNMIFRDVDAEDLGELDADISVVAVADDSQVYPDSGPTDAGSHVPTDPDGPGCSAAEEPEAE